MQTQRSKSTQFQFRAGDAQGFGRNYSYLDQPRDIPHTVVSTDGVFKSNVRDTDEKFSYTFAKPGTSILLLGPPKDDWEGRGPVGARYFYLALPRTPFRF